MTRFWNNLHQVRPKSKDTTHKDGYGNIATPTTHKDGHGNILTSTTHKDGYGNIVTSTTHKKVGVAIFPCPSSHVIEIRTFNKQHYEQEAKTKWLYYDIL
jgi:hypothetical protein